VNFQITLKRKCCVLTNTHSVVLGNKREIDISIDKLKSFENNQVESKIVYSTIDEELWRRRNGKLSQKDYITCDKTISQFFTEYYKVQNQQDKRKKDIMFGVLYNSDASPIKREDKRGKKPDELTIIIRMIVLSVLKNKKISTHNMTLFDWLRKFYIINDGFYADYKSDRKV
ncbi:hypothetical protein DB521_RS11795, partial [Staphylococcus pseudintermedius]|nr:hypothetical protein [Staphylococcus pseudintermedius]